MATVPTGSLGCGTENVLGSLASQVPVSGRWDSRCSLSSLSLLPWYVGMGLYFCTYVASIRCWVAEELLISQPHSGSGLLCMYHYRKLTDTISSQWRSWVGRTGLEHLFWVGRGTGKESIPSFHHSGPTCGHSIHTVRTVGRFLSVPRSLESLDCWIILPFPPDVWTET